MTSRKSSWLLAGLAALCLAAPAGAADASKLVPADAEQVVFVNVEALLKSELVKKHALDQVKAALKDNADAKKLFDAIGLDPLKDINSVLVANAGQKGDKVLVVAQGKFDLEKIHKLAEAVAREKKDELKILKEGTKTVYQGTKDGNSLYASFVDKNTMVASTSKAYVVAALKGEGGKPGKALATAMKAVDTR